MAFDQISIILVSEATDNEEHAFNYGDCPHESGHFLPSDYLECRLNALDESIASVPVVLDDLHDVDATDPDDGDVLTWDDGSEEWIASPPTGGSGGGGLNASVIDVSAGSAVSSTSFADTDMAIAVAANTTYEISSMVFFNTNATTVGIKLAFNGPASPTLLKVGGFVATGPGNANDSTIGQSSVVAYDTVIVTATSGPGATNAVAILSGVFQNGSTAGTLTLRHASETATLTTIEAGSYLKLTPTATSWTDYTPVLTGSVSNPTLGSSTLTGRYKLLDPKTLIFSFRLVVTTGGAWNAGSGNWEFSLPSGMTSAARQQVIYGHVLDSGTTHYAATGSIAASATKTFELYVADGAAPRVLTNAAPVTWATNDAVEFSGTIEIA